LLPRRPQTRDVSRATALQSTQGPSQRLLKQSAVKTIDAATTWSSSMWSRGRAKSDLYDCYDLFDICL